MCFDRLETPKTAHAARAVLERKTLLQRARSTIETLLADRHNGLSSETQRALQRSLKAQISDGLACDRSEYHALQNARQGLAEAEVELAETLESDLARTRRSLLNAAHDILPRYFVFGPPGVHDLLAEALPAGTSVLPTRNKRARERERHLLLYLQRIAGKNDTFSEFGPSGWGRSEKGFPGLALAPEAGFQRREAFVERWAAHAVAAAMNGDPLVRPELAPRLHPNGRLENGAWVSADHDDALPLSSSAAALHCRL